VLLISAVYGYEWSASHSDSFTPRERDPGTQIRMGGPQSRPERDGEEKNSQPPSGIEP